MIKQYKKILKGTMRTLKKLKTFKSISKIINNYLNSKKTDVEIAIENMNKYRAGKIKCPIQGK